MTNIIGINDGKPVDKTEETKPEAQLYDIRTIDDGESQSFYGFLGITPLFIYITSPDEKTTDFLVPVENLSSITRIDNASDDFATVQE